MFERSVMQRLSLAVLAVLGAGCHAQAHAHAQGGVSSEEDDRKYEVAEESSSPASVPVPGIKPPPMTAPSPRDATYVIGVVHDLSLSSSATRSAACRCLAVGYGPPSDPKFAWQAGPPSVEPGTMAVAIAADGVSCAARGYAPLRASISAVEVDGDDVVLVVENVRNGAPAMRGALVSPPSDKGALIVRARKGAPYGAPSAGGSGPCRLARQ